MAPGPYHLLTYILLASGARSRTFVPLGKRWQENNTFDYIIVGGGTAGLVLANRLSETEGIKVVVVEAGGDYEGDPLKKAIVDIPGLDAEGAGADITAPANMLSIDWGFSTVPQKAFANRSIHYERGKVVGGSSTRNFQIYQRGTASSYDSWAALGNEGWDWKSLKPYFEKSVKYQPPDNSLRRLARPTPPDEALAESQTRGPLSLSVAPFPQAFGPFMIGALKELGIPEVTTFNNGTLRGGTSSLRLLC
ncbi:hypothetical protein P7C70_g4129, partial [Phenoliferia sp. Uapishka_3]